MKEKGIMKPGQLGSLQDRLPMTVALFCLRFHSYQRGQWHLSVLDAYSQGQSRVVERYRLVATLGISWVCACPSCLHPGHTEE